MKKGRVSITFPQPYLDFMSLLVKKGLYLNRGAVMMDGLRVLAERHGIPLGAK